MRAAMARRSDRLSALPGVNPLVASNVCSSNSVAPVTRSAFTRIDSPVGPVSGCTAGGSILKSGVVLGFAGIGGICCSCPPALVDCAGAAADISSADVMITDLSKAASDVSGNVPTTSLWAREPEYIITFQWFRNCNE